jgi:hypothetical protein
MGKDCLFVFNKRVHNPYILPPGILTFGIILFPGNTVPLLLNGKLNRCICGNEYVPLLVIDAAVQKLVTDSNVPRQRNRGRIVVLSLQPFVNQLLASLRRGKTEGVIRWPPRREDISSPPALRQRVSS